MNGLMEDGVSATNKRWIRGKDAVLACTSGLTIWQWWENRRVFGLNWDERKRWIKSRVFGRDILSEKVIIEGRRGNDGLELAVH